MVGRVWPRHGRRGRPLNSVVSRHMASVTTRTVSLGQVESAIRASWSAETSHSPREWSNENPCAGQCWTTAYVVRHFLGGEIVVAEVEPRSSPVQRHAWNRLPGGAEVDLTREQFGPRQT